MTEESLFEPKGRAASGSSHEPGLLAGFVLPNLLLILSIGFAVWVFAPKLDISFQVPKLQGHSQYRITAAEIEITPAPRWVPPDLVQQVVSQAGLPNEMSLLEPDLSQRIAAAFERHPWVKGNVQVRTSVPARIQVSLEYREPIAMVRTPSGLFPIDAQAVVLPSADFAPATVAKFPVIDNVATQPRGRAGTSWGDLRVLGAAQLAETLKPYWVEFGFKSIQVVSKSMKSTSDTTALAANQANWDQLSYRIGTRGGSQLIWGRPPGSKHPGELTAEKKLGRIQFYLRNHGSFDSSHGPCEYDLTRWKEISRKPLAEKSTADRRKG